MKTKSLLAAALLGMAALSPQSLWVNGEFTPRETMRGKMALLGYLYGIRK